MPNYVTLLPRAFKKFGLKNALKTAAPTAWYYLKRPCLEAGAKPALFTMNILPPMMTVWYHCVRKYLGDKVDVVIFDSSARLKKNEFPGAKVYKFLNLYAATKSEEFIRHIAKHRQITWLCDDDMFLLSGDALDILNREFAVPKTAAVSFRPREWWHLEIDGKSYLPISSYCTAFDRSILIDQENLSLKPAPGNNHPSHIGKPPGRYDTCDLANEKLIKRGYRCAIVPPEEREHCTAEFTGLSGPVMLLNYFKNPQQTLNYYLTPPAEQWSGNMLYGTLSAMIAITFVQDFYQQITGHRYPLPALPERKQLEEILQANAHHLRSDQDINQVYKAAAKLQAHL